MAEESFQIKEYYRDLISHNGELLFAIKVHSWGNGRDKNKVFRLHHAGAWLLFTLGQLYCA